MAVELNQKQYRKVKIQMYSRSMTRQKRQEAGIEVGEFKKAVDSQPCQAKINRDPNSVCRQEGCVCGWGGSGEQQARNAGRPKRNLSSCFKQYVWAFEACFYDRQLQ